MQLFKKLLPVSLLAVSVLGVSTPVFAGTQYGYQFDDSVVNGAMDFETQLDEPVIKIQERSAKPRQVILSIPFQTQQTYYYCGPASAAMVVNSLGYNKTQNEMASLLGTTTAGTAAGNGVANALNAVVRGSRYKFTWEWHNYNQVDKMKNHVVEALSWGNPVMVNTVESPGDVYLRGHNIGSPIYHFGVIGDYFDYGNSVTYTDPGYGRFSGFVMDQRVSIKDMSYATGGRGYAW